MTEPSVDILMATYNGERYIGEQIESIQRQTYSNWRLLVSDDCSSDGTLDIVRRYAAEDERIHIASEGVRYGGAKENFFALMRKTNASYVMFCDQDDVWRDDKVAIEMRSVLDNEVVYGRSCPIMAHSNLSLIDGGGCALDGTMRDMIPDVDIACASPAQMILIGVATGCTMILNRACIDESLRIETIGNAHMHDWWVALVASMLGRRVYLDECLVFYRQHENNVIGAPKKYPPSSLFVKFKKCALAVVKHRLEPIGKGLASCYSDYFRQACEFRRVYQARLSIDYIHDLDAVCDLVDSGLIRKLSTLSEYRLWHKGLNGKFHQLSALHCLKRGR